MFERLESIRKKVEFLESELAKEEIIKDLQKTRAYSKELVDLKQITNIYDEYLRIDEKIKEDKEYINDKELGEIAKKEIEELEIEKSKYESELEILLLPKDPNDDKNIIIEIRGAAGGDEANIFAGNLFEMYTRYADTEGFKIEILDAMQGTSGGYSQISFMVKGNGAYSKLKYESGAHRVQRVPTTETQGRIHTSTATVLVLPEADELDVDIKQSDLRIDVYRSSGCGGQGVNTTDSAVRITHIPSGIVVTCQNERSQIQNKEKCMQILRARLYEKTEQEQNEKQGNERRSKIGTGDRSEKIRTYNYPQNRVTDHRINLTVMDLDRVMSGKLGEIIEALITADQKKRLEVEDEA